MPRISARAISMAPARRPLRGSLSCPRRPVAPAPRPASRPLRDNSSRRGGVVAEGDTIALRAVTAVAGDAEPRTSGRLKEEGMWRQAELLHGPWPRGFHHHVRVVDEPAERASAGSG